MIRRLALLVLVVGGVAPVLRGDAAPPVLVAPGVTLAGIPVGGMSAEQAQAAVAPGFGRPLRLVQGEREWLVRPGRFAASVAIADGVSHALDAAPDTAVPLVPEVDLDAVRTYVRALARRYEIPAKDAKLLGISALRPSFSQPQAGVEILRKTTVTRIVNGLQSATRPRVRLASRLIAPKVTPKSFGPVVVIRRAHEQLLYYDGTRRVRTFPVATGQARYPTPLGTFSVVDLQRNPWWRPPNSEWAKGLKPIPPGPGNPLGTRWMGLSAAGVGMHGTPDDASIGYSASHGCIRMHIPDAEWMFEHVRIGTPVIITDA